MPIDSELRSGMNSSETLAPGPPSRKCLPSPDSCQAASTPGAVALQGRVDAGSSPRVSSRLDEGREHRDGQRGHLDPREHAEACRRQGMLLSRRDTRREYDPLLASKNFLRHATTLGKTRDRRNTSIACLPAGGEVGMAACSSGAGPWRWPVTFVRPRVSRSPRSRSASAVRRRRSRPTSNAPRGALLYPRRSRDELEGRFVGLMAYPDPRGERNNRMPAKRRSAQVSGPGCRGTRVIWRKLDCLKPNLQKTQRPVRRKGTRDRRHALRRHRREVAATFGAWSVAQ